MADPICRWRNSSVKQVLEFNSLLPSKPMLSKDARAIVEKRCSFFGVKDFFTTPYQLAVQMGMYYEDDDFFYPQFSTLISCEEALTYLLKWGVKYYAPNPYTKSMDYSQKPVLINNFLVNWVLENENPLFSEALKKMFSVSLGNTDILINMLNNFSEVSIKNDIISLKDNAPKVTYQNVSLEVDPHDKKAFFEYIGQIKVESARTSNKNTTFRQYITAIKSKPFLLLAGISGTGKSRIVRELARACWEEGSEEYKAQKPKNFEMIQVKPNWHDSSELVGYVSRINGEKYVVGPFLKFIVKAIQDPETPHFLCLDEMNLAPVEQYFAEYLSLIESRKVNSDGEIVTDPIIDYDDTDAYKDLIDQLFMGNDAERALYLTENKTKGKRLSLPSNLIVVGTVNMDETTFSFSRKVLDRAMTIEMNDVDLHGGLLDRYEKISKLGGTELIGSAVEGIDVYEAYKNECEVVLTYLASVNDVLNNTPFKIAYRTRNEFLLYVVNNLPYNKNDEGSDIANGVVVARALDEITSMKILSRIEGDDTKVSKLLLDKLSDTISEGLNTIVGEGNTYTSKVSLPKLNEMKTRLESGYTSFWS